MATYGEHQDTALCGEAEAKDCLETHLQAIEDATGHELSILDGLLGEWAPRPNLPPVNAPGVVPGQCVRLREVAALQKHIVASLRELKHKIV